MSDLLLPGRIADELNIEGAFDRDPTCEAAHVGQYADSHRKYVRCAIAKDHFPLAGSNQMALAAASFCFGAYRTCPVWLRAHDGRLKEIDDNLHRRAVARETKRQIETGLRVNDRGLPDPEATTAPHPDA